jgi:hypothetical protein
MGTPAQTPMPPAAGGPPPGGPPGAGGVSPSGPPPGGPGGGSAQSLAKLAMDAQKIASESPETAPMMREVQNQVRMATMKMIQQRQATQQATPAI